MHLRHDLDRLVAVRYGCKINCRARERARRFAAGAGAGQAADFVSSLLGATPRPLAYTSAMGLERGDRIAGKYRVERKLGEGGMGAVYAAENEKLRKWVALKVLSDAYAGAEGGADRFVREAIAASSVKHPGIVEIYDADVHEGVPWIAMELLN